MSYSFQIRTPDKASAKSKIKEEFDVIVAREEMHKLHDRDAAQAAAFAFVDMLPDNADHDVAVSVSGYVGWQGSAGPDAKLVSANFSVNAAWTARS